MTLCMLSISALFSSFLPENDFRSGFVRGGKSRVRVRKNGQTGQSIATLVETTCMLCARQMSL